MCGIGGFSLSKDSNIHPRQLANSLLTCLEDRGGMASGFAFQDEDRNGYYKAPVAGSQLSLKTMPKDTKNVIVHTRLATHGSTKDNRNNHPVISPGGNVALVHNGVIYNHEAVRLNLDSAIDFEVDTAVIPALIESDDTLKRLTELDGDAAIAWFDARSRGTLNIARLEHSPLVIAQVEDGSLIFASTEDLLWRVLIQLDLTPTYMETSKEYEYFQVRNGVISVWQELTRPAVSSRTWDYSYYRKQTAGGKSDARTESIYGYDGYAEWYGGSSAYGADWDDEDIAEWESYNGVPSSKQMNDDYSVEIEPDDVDPIMLYIKTRESHRQKDDVVYYFLDEYDLFKNDIWYVKATGDERELLDYGRSDYHTAELLSYMHDPAFEKEDTKKLRLA
jgi:predicted glutamine amidotransferase